MHKQCTAGDRQKLAVEIPRVASALEMVLPVYVMTMVWHVLVFHALLTLVNTGPFSVANMLVIERFHTVFKSLARGTRNVMMSIRNHYLLLETALCNRNSGTQTWSNRAPRSTAAGYAARAGSKDRTERLWSVHGKMTVMKLRDVEFQEIINLWRAHDLEYDTFWERFLASSRRNKVDGKFAPRLTDIRRWRPRYLSAKERQFQQMTKKVQVALFVLFN